MFNYSCFKNKWINVINTLDPKSSTDGAKTLQQKRSVQRLQTNRAFIFSRTKPPVRPTKRCSYIQTRQVVVLTCDLSLSLSVFFPPWNFTVKLVGFLVFPCLLLVYTVVLDWNRILGFFSFWAGSWSRQTQSRLTSSPRRFPRQFAVCVNTLFLPSSSPLPACPLTASSTEAYSVSAHMWW